MLLRALPRIAGNDLVFPGSRNSRPLSDMSLSAVVRRMNEGEDGPRWVDEAREEVVPHGFRSTFRDWAAEVTHYPNEMARNSSGAHHRQQGRSGVPARRHAW